MDGLDEVPWHKLHGAHGHVADVPQHIRALRGHDPHALAELSNAVYHQGTRWQVSAHVVPFLVALIDDPDTPDRADLVGLLQAVALGDRDDSELPFEPDRVFAAAAGLTDAQVEAVVHELYYADDPMPSELFDRVAVRWDADAYLAAAGHSNFYSRWLTDSDVRVASHAAALLPWFAAADISALLAVPAERATVRASANLALAYLDGDGVDDALRGLLSDVEPVVAITAAAALASRVGERIPDSVLDILVLAKETETPPGWHRSMRGYVAMALRRLGL